MCSCRTNVITALLRKFAVFHFLRDKLSIHHMHRFGVFTHNRIHEHELELFLGLLLVQDVVVVKSLQRNVHVHVPRLTFTNLFCDAEVLICLPWTQKVSRMVLYQV